MDTLRSHLESALTPINEHSSNLSVEMAERFRPTKKTIAAKLSNPESEGITWEQLIQRLCEIFESDEIDVDQVFKVVLWNLYEIAQ